jgi:integrase
VRAVTNIPIHTALRAAINGYSAALPVVPHPAMTMFAGRTGKLLPYTTLFRGIWGTAIKINLKELWLHDFRRTCVVKLAKAGFSVAEIGAIARYSDQSVHRMMRNYLPKTFAMARNVITKLGKNR